MKIGDGVPDDLTIWRETELDAGVYIGGFCTHMKEVKVKWDTEERDGFTWEHLTLKQIHEQCKDAALIWVITTSALYGEIYEYGNYSDGKWRLFGVHMGYA